MCTYTHTTHVATHARTSKSHTPASRIHTSVHALTYGYAHTWLQHIVHIHIRMHERTSQHLHALPHTRVHMHTSEPLHARDTDTYILYIHLYVTPRPPNMSVPSPPTCPNPPPNMMSTFHTDMHHLLPKTCHTHSTPICHTHSPLIYSTPSHQHVAPPVPNMRISSTQHVALYSHNHVPHTPLKFLHPPYQYVPQHP